MTAWQGTRILCNAADYADYAVLKVTKILFNTADYVDTAGDQKILQYCRLCRWPEYHAIQITQMLQVTRILCNTADYADTAGDQKIRQKKFFVKTITFSQERFSFPLFVQRSRREP